MPCLGSDVSRYGWLLCDVSVMVSVIGCAVQPRGTEYAWNYSLEVAKDKRIAKDCIDSGV